MTNRDAYTELSVKLEYMANSIEKMDDTMKEILLEQRTTGALIARERERINSIEKQIITEADDREKESNKMGDYIRENNENVLNKMKVWVYAIAISALVTIAGFIKSFI